MGVSLPCVSKRGMSFLFYPSPAINYDLRLGPCSGALTTKAEVVRHGCCNHGRGHDVATWSRLSTVIPWRLWWEPTQPGRRSAAGGSFDVALEPLEAEQEGVCGSLTCGGFPPPVTAAGFGAPVICCHLSCPTRGESAPG